MSDDADIAVLKVEIAALKNKVDAMEKTYSGHIQKVVWGLILAAAAVLWEPFRAFWANVQGK